MNNSVLTVGNLSKRFWIGGLQEKGARYLVEKTLREPLSIFKPVKRKEFWALKDINFEVKEGERWAIIGRNGAGKSTLLKLISRVSLPTKGFITLNGRIGSLLEVGTGFHPELTGRENIYLNGALLGMRKAEINKAFDAIVYFAEISEFLETPVKRYSSGMYVRLAFAVAAHLQKEILIVDEVLAVGDQRFQKKCLEKMNEVSRTGRSILFVSHNMALLQGICQKGLLLDSGNQVAQGELGEVLEIYQKRLTVARESTPEGIKLDKVPRATGHFSIFKKLSFLKKGEFSPALCATPGTNVSMILNLEFSPQTRKHLKLVARITHPTAGNVFSLNTWAQNVTLSDMSEKTALQCDFVLPPLASGIYNLALELYSDGKLVDEIPFAAEIEVAPHDYLESGRQPSPNEGVLLVKSQWTRM